MGRQKRDRGRDRFAIGAAVHTTDEYSRQVPEQPRAGRVVGHEGNYLVIVRFGDRLRAIPVHMDFLRDR